MQPGCFPLLHGGGHQEAAGQDGHIPRYRRGGAAQEGGQLPERDRVPVRRAGTPAHRRGGAAQAQPEGAAVVAGGRARMGAPDRLRRVHRELRRQPRGRRPAAAAHREQPAR